MRIQLITRLIVGLVLTQVASGLAFSEEVATKKILKIAWRGDDGTLEVYDHSDSYTNIMAVNAGGQVLGTREWLEPKIAVLSQSYFFSDGSKTVDLPKLNGYTNSEFQSLSDDGKVVGYASRAPGNPNGALTAIVWDAKTGKVTDLGKLPKDTASQATDISSDGKRIVGYSTGAQPARVTPCVWEQVDENGPWIAKPLSVVHKHNPFVVSSGVVISPDGKRIASCPTFRIVKETFYDSSLYTWQLSGGQWDRTELSEMAGHIRDISNAGVIALSISTGEGMMPHRVNAKGELVNIDLLPGDKTGQANAVGPNGSVYGFSDDPPGPAGGPQAFVASGGKTQPLKQFAPRGVYSSVNAVNASGQLVGFVDVIVRGGRTRLPNSPEEIDKLEADDSVIFKTLGFRWTPKK